MKKSVTLLFIFALLASPLLVKAQASKTLPAEYKILSMKKLMDLDQSTLVNLPVYDIDGKLITTQKAQELMSKGEFLPDYYVDESGKPAAMKLRKPTAQEQAMLSGFFEEQKRMEALIGTPAKDFEAMDMDGNAINLADMKGSVVAINFWFVGCKPCIQEMPELNEIVEEYKNADIKFIAIALDSKSALEKFAQRKQFDYDVIPNGRPVSQIYDVTGYPTHCIVDQEGNIAYFQTGYSPQTASELKKTIEKLLHK